MLPSVAAAVSEPFVAASAVAAFEATLDWAVIDQAGCSTRFAAP